MKGMRDKSIVHQRLKNRGTKENRGKELEKKLIEPEETELIDSR